MLEGALEMGTKEAMEVIQAVEVEAMAATEETTKVTTVGKTEMVRRKNTTIHLHFQRYHRVPPPRPHHLLNGLRQL